MTKMDLCIILTLWMLPIFMMGVATHQNMSVYASMIIGVAYSTMLCIAWVNYTLVIKRILESKT